MTTTRAPAHLGADGKALWARLLRDYEINDGAGLQLLQVAAEAADRAASCRKAIDGLTVKDARGSLKPHPLLAVERDARAQQIAALRALRLAPSGRPGD